MNRHLLSVILPTYNEAENIVPLIYEIVKVLEKEKLSFELIVVDDNSPDGTASKIRNEFRDERIKLFIRRKERGLAKSIREGIERACGALILIMDTDFNHNPLYIPEMLKAIPRYDLVIGSRYVRGGGMPFSKARYLTSLFANMFVRIILAIPYRDSLTGFFLLKKEKLNEIDSEKIFHGYGDYAIRFLYAFRKKGIRVKEIPVVYEERGGGKSKTNMFKIALQYLLTIFELKIRKQ